MDITIRLSSKKTSESFFDCVKVFLREYYEDVKFFNDFYENIPEIFLKLAKNYITIMNSLLEIYLKGQMTIETSLYLFGYYFKAMKQIIQ